MLWKELLWRLVTGISTSEFLLNSGIFFSALSIGRKWTNYQEPSDLLKRIHHLILLFGDRLCWEVKRESEQICLVAPKTLYISVPISIPETFGKTELSDIVIVFYPVILMQFYHCQISAGILLALQGQKQVSSRCTFAPSTPNGRSLWRCGTLYSEFVWHDLCKLCRQ